MDKLYQVPTNLHTLEPIEIDVINRSKYHYWDKNGFMNAFETTNHKTFETKQDAIDWIELKIHKMIEEALVNVNKGKDLLSLFDSMY
jgi:hypothetical protein